MLWNEGLHQYCSGIHDYKVTFRSTWRELLSSVSGRVSVRPICDLVDASHDFPIIILEVDNLYITSLGCKYPLQFQTCHDHANKLYYTTAFFKRFSSRHWIWSLSLAGKKTRASSRRVQAPRESIGKKGSRIWSLKILRESGMFPNHSFSILELLQFLYASFERQYNLRTYWTSSRVRLNKEKCRNYYQRLQLSCHEGKQELEKTKYFWWLNHFVQLNVNLISLSHQKLSCLTSGVSNFSRVSLPINRE